MTTAPILSMIIPPFPTFIEGNFTSYSAGQQHPNRNNLPYFDLLFVLKGTLYITEENTDYEIKKGEMLVLSPFLHHFSTKPCTENTDFYWLHFHYDGHWEALNQPIQLNSDVIMPELHYHNEDYTLHLKKYQKLSDSKFIYALLDRLLLGTVGEKKSIVFWDNQKRFSQLLKSLEEQSYSKTNVIDLAENIELYIKQNYAIEITNSSLSKHFHFHENYLVRSMKQVFQCTPLEYLSNYRLDKAASYLIKTNLSMTDISIKCGFNNSAYFSLCFKKKYAISPLNYRRAHSGK
ncbi:helix-turn-helix domain-containing protein [uncultured Enterococcus sp.]|uniref:helix-turn-helix domain-containing protein n=1 Tax=uncultured Enterococcus sp. TaxID=167972 RepID=UPI002AA5FEDD|nr:helix-turn-helix domain-containing protein [uncultured Enterococcus sp.]